MEVKEMARLGQKAFRENNNLKDSESVSKYFKELRKKRKNYSKGKSVVDKTSIID